MGYYRPMYGSSTGELEMKPPVRLCPSPENWKEHVWVTNRSDRNRPKDRSVNHIKTMSANQEDPFKVTSWMMYQESSTDQRHKTRNRLMRSFSVSFKKR